jgi:CheY-like chemotaxis protein
MAPVDLNAALSANAEVLERVLGGAITVVWDLTDANATTRTDADLFEQMVLNLSTNARDAMGGAGTLTFATNIVTREHEERVADFVRVRISDTGSGMDEETMAKCFEPLFTTKGPLKGTGMGLAGARRLVEESRGFVEVTSELGRGTTFSFFFPVSREEAATATPPLVHTEAVIAVVDDDVALRQMMVHLLRRYGYEVREYGNPLDVASDPTIGDVALVVSEVLMPELTGVELARDLGERFPDVALLLVSGTADHDVLDGLKPGVTLLAKPFRPSALVDAVHHQLAQRAARR